MAGPSVPSPAAFLGAINALLNGLALVRRESLLAKIWLLCEFRGAAATGSWLKGIERDIWITIHYVDGKCGWHSIEELGYP